MASLASEQRSALRHRPIDSSAATPDVVLVRRQRAVSEARTATAPIPTDKLAREPRPERRVTRPEPQQKSLPPARVRRSLHPLFSIGMGLLLAVLLWAGLTQLLAWGTNQYNTIVYGYPRTFQMDQVVGNQDSSQNPSHFMAMNLKGHIIIIEIPGGDISKSMVFSGPTLLGTGGDLVPVTLTFQDAHHNGRPDMIVHVQGELLVFLDKNGTFVPAPQGQNRGE